eukprot:TRINITY_DN1992_c0_g1_i4.p1 TRINITY_DN1992_c0_g1~~TRINITY_DN1992_c0_g1_i4.p1  ORF type:complete len:245 (-),score=27.04 TRINITY_DN1992_c0_g1_i4:338-1072(-)
MMPSKDELDKGEGLKKEEQNILFLGNDETLSLLSSGSEKSKVIVSEAGFACQSSYFPYLTFICFLISVAIGLVQYGQWQKIPLKDVWNELPKFTVLPTLRPYYFQIISLVGSGFLFATYYSLLMYLRQKFAVPEYKTKRKFLALIFTLGFISLFFYVLFAMFPSEKFETQKERVDDDEHIFITLYFVFSFLFILGTHYLFFVIKRDKSLVKNEDCTVKLKVLHLFLLSTVSVVCTYSSTILALK